MSEIRTSTTLYFVFQMAHNLLPFITKAFISFEFLDQFGLYAFGFIGIKRGFIMPSRENKQKYQAYEKLLPDTLTSKGHPHPHDLGVKRVFLKIYILRIFCRMIFANANKRLEDIINWGYG